MSKKIYSTTCAPLRAYLIGHHIRVAQYIAPDCHLIATLLLSEDSTSTTPVGLILIIT